MDGLMIARAVRQDVMENTRRKMARYYAWSCAGMMIVMVGYGGIAMFKSDTWTAVGGMVTSGLFAIAAGLFHLRS